MLPGNGKVERTGLGSDSKCKEAVNTAFNYLKANANRISGSISTTTKDYIINYQDIQGIGMTEKLALPTLPFFVSTVMNCLPLAAGLPISSISDRFLSGVKAAPPFKTPPSIPSRFSSVSASREKEPSPEPTSPSLTVM